MSYSDSKSIIIENLRKCIRCGLCLGACPIYSIDKEEVSSPRGRLHIIDKIYNKAVFKEFLNNCLLCGRCIDVCPNGVDIPSLIREVREKEGIAKEVYSFAKIIQGQDFKSFKIFAKILNIDRNTGGLIKLFSKGRSLPNLASEKVIYNDTLEFKTIAIFTGCLSPLFSPSVVNKIAGFYRGLGYNVYIPKGQLCCGLMNYSAGDTERSLEFATRNIEMFSSEKIEKIITPCTSCAYMFDNYKKIVKGGDIISKKVVSLDNNIFDTLSNRLERSEMRLGIHIPCHIRNSLNKCLYNQFKGLRSYKNVRVIDSCCGYGGIFNLYEYQRSIKVGEKIIKELSNVDVIYTCCSGCYLQIYDLLSRYNINANLTNIAELLEP